MSPTRERILERLRAAPATSKELAQELGLSRVAVHRHLSELMARGFVRAEVKRCPGKGRPYRVYRAQDPEAPYARLCLDVLDHLEALFGPEGVAQVLKRRNEELKRELAPGLSGLPLREKAERLARRLKEEGYEAEVVEEGGELFLVQHRCPKLALAARYGVFCELELSLYRELLGLEVERQSRIAQGDEACRYRLT
jgi:predicted ArsR family transcriptional regulator